VPAPDSSLTSLRASIDRQDQVLSALSRKNSLTNTPLIVDLKDKLAITRRRINTLAPLLTNVIDTISTLLTPLSSSPSSVRLVISPRENVLADVASSNLRVLEANRAHTNIGIGPEAETILADGGVPFFELVKGDAELGGDDEAVVAWLDVVEGVAVVDHARLDGEWSGDAVVALDGLNGCGLLGGGAGTGEDTCAGGEKGCDGRELHFGGEVVDIELFVCLLFEWLIELRKMSPDRRNSAALYRFSS
jgi:hypothetical protein